MTLHRRQVTYSSHPNHAARRAHAQGDQMFRTYDTSYITGRNQRHNRAKTVCAVIVAVIFIGLLIFGIVSCKSHTNKEKLVEAGTTVSITVNEGETAQDIAESLAAAKLIAHPKDFTQAVKKANAASTIKAGVYTIAGATSVEDIIAMMVNGPVPTSFTVPEGSTATAIAQTVEKAYDGRITADAIMARVNDASAYQDEYPFVAGAYNNSLEGFLFPKTYDVVDGATADTVVRQMLAQYQIETKQLDYAYPKAQNLDAYQTLILASMIEKESDDQVRDTVASVFYNRLAADMRLQSDATVAYVVRHDPTPEDIHSTESPYNTYSVDGLPAGPICSPGLASLQAACAPASTDYLYFYFQQNDAGGMDYFFSKTHEEHQAAIAGESSATSVTSGK